MVFASPRCLHSAASFTTQARAWALSGAGRIPSVRAKITAAEKMERFQRVPDAHGRVIEGSGIGLAMVREIVALHRGTVSLQSEPGQGATFTVHLPRQGPPARTGEALAASPEELAPIFPDELGGEIEAPPMERAPGVERHRPRLLLVEDNPEMSAFLQRLLSPHFRVTAAPDGEVGLKMAREQLPDGVLSDVMMARLDGLELCRRLKADLVTRHIPVILVSARHGAEATLEGFSAGADDYIVKPFSAPELIARVDAQLRVRRLGLALMRAEKQTTLGLMAAGIAHEVRNPINALLNAVGPLRREMRKMSAEGAEDEEGLVEALLDSIDRSGQRIRQVVDSMLALSRQTPGELRLREVRLSESIDATLGVLRFRQRDDLQVRRDYQWDGPVWCYPELVGQVVMNLVVNALDAVDEEGGTIQVVLRREGDAIRLEVADDGPGVPAELQELIFEPFFTTKAPAEGTGLGLAVSREIAALHGGALELEQRGDRGAVFVLTLPAGMALQPPRPMPPGVELESRA
jgi:signal transduction histidine kinase